MYKRQPKHIPIVESDETNPTNTYGETKLAMEKMMKWCDQASVSYTHLYDILNKDF